MKLPILLLLPAFAFSQGCVLKAKYDDTLASQLQCESNLKRSASDRDQLAPKLDDIKKRLAEAEARNEELSQTNLMLASKNSDFTKRSLETQQDALLYKEQKEHAEQRAILVKQSALELGKPFQAEVATYAMTIKPEGDNVLVSIPAASMFTSLFDDLSSNGRKLLERLATQIRKQKPTQVRVESFGEPPPPPKKGKSHPTSAWEATADMSAKIVKALELQGIEPSKLSACGMGAGEAKTRHVDLKITF